MEEKMKIRLFVDVEKEERWLNEQLSLGYELVDIRFGCFYYFIEASSSDLQICSDFRQFKNLAEYEEYITFMEDSGWQHVGGNRKEGTQYFKGNKTLSPDGLFSDNDSKLLYYKRVEKQALTSASIIIPSYILIFGRQTDLFGILKWKTFFYTPGLWQREGSALTKGVLFELPFALMRLLSCYFLLIIVIWLCWTLIRIYRKTRALEQTL